MTKTTFTIGRNADKDIVLPNDSKISRNHVSVYKKNNLYIVENLSKRNPILQDQEQKSKFELHPGQKFQVGESELEFIWGETPGKSLNPTVVPNLVLNSVQNSATNKLPQNAGSPHNLIIPKNNYEVPSQASNQKMNQDNSNISKKRKQKPKANNKVILIIFITVAALIFFLLPDKNSAKKLKKNSLRSSEEIQKALEASRLNITTYQKEKRIQEDGSIDKQFESSQSYYIRGFRDYRQGQYSRAIQAFQAALSFDPNHILSRKYLNLSLKKLDELVQFNLSQGRRYREKSNYRLCKSAFQQVMIIKKDPNDSVYKEAKQLFDECDTLHKGRY
jgi:tetratricopeptide (TPR) repeat protein